MSQGARVSWDVSRSCRATAQKASGSVSSVAESRPPARSRSWVTGIGYQPLLLQPHIEVTSITSFPGSRAPERGPTQENRAALWLHLTPSGTSTAQAGAAAQGP